MDYEKAYKEALERAREFQKSKDGLCVLTAESIFPELKESEDERIRKAIAEMIHDTPNVECEKNYNVCKEDILAWLEKQKEIDKEIVFRPLAGTDIRIAAKQALEKIEIGKEVILAFNGAYIPVNGKTVAEICNEYFSWTEKQGEKKVPSVDFKAKDCYVSEVDGNIHDMTYNAADNVESKFHKDNWIVNNITKDVFLIKSINNGYCTLEDIEGNIISPCLPFESEFHLWTIADAKEGDVLCDYCEEFDNPLIFILKKFERVDFGLVKPSDYSSYCFLTMDDIQKFKEGTYHHKHNVKPATKEQRNLLFQRMKEAGYEWDGEKKVFKMIDENSKYGVVEYVYILDYSTGRVIVAKHDLQETIESLFNKLGLKESQCHYMVSSDILSIEYINF